MQFHRLCAFLTIGLVVGSAACTSDSHTSPTTIPTSSVTLAADSVEPVAVPIHTAAAAYPSLPPTDITHNNSELRAFVKQVISYARGHQLQQLLAVADDSIVVSYGGGLYGKSAFADYLNNVPTDGYNLISKVLEMGGALDEPNPETSKTNIRYCFPYCQSGLLWKKVLPGVDVDPYETFIGLTPQVRLYEKPDKGSRVLATLAYPVLLFNEERAEAAVQKGWLTLQTMDGKVRGSVPEPDVYSAADMTLLIERKQGTYKITSVAVFD